MAVGVGGIAWAKERMHPLSAGSKWVYKSSYRPADVSQILHRVCQTCRVESVEAISLTEAFRELHRVRGSYGQVYMWINIIVKTRRQAEIVCSFLRY